MIASPKREEAMVRRARVEVEGGLYHVYNRVASGEPIFADPEEAVEFIETVRETKTRDGWIVLAWCVMSNHYHLVIRTATVPLWRGMHRVQNLFSRRFNIRHGRTGSLWQSRYKAKYVEDETYLNQLILYVHLNPVRAGATDDPAEFVFGGHREIKRRIRNSLVDIEEALFCFGTGRNEARRSYLSAMRAETDPAGDTGRLSWHPFTVEEKDLPLEVDRRSPKIDVLGRSTDLERPTLDPTVYVKAVCVLLGIEMAVVCSRVRDSGTASARKMIVTLGVERWRQSRVGLARVLQKNPDMVSWWAGEGAKSRTSDPEYAAKLDRLDEALASKAAKMTASERSCSTF
jgi:REP element-mobilizing transposase RayT